MSRAPYKVEIRDPGELDSPRGQHVLDIGTDTLGTVFVLTDDELTELFIAAGKRLGIGAGG